MKSQSLFAAVAVLTALCIISLTVFTFDHEISSHSASALQTRIEALLRKVDSQPGYSISLDRCDLIVTQEVPHACEKGRSWWLRRQEIPLQSIDFRDTARQLDSATYVRAGHAALNLIYKKYVGDRNRHLRSGHDQILARSRTQFRSNQDAAGNAYIQFLEEFGASATHGHPVATYCSGQKSVWINIQSGATVFVPADEARDLVRTLADYATAVCN